LAAGWVASDVQARLGSNAWAWAWLWQAQAQALVEKQFKFTG